jgi:diguanylate cyclase (GGDEF)-like protein
MRPIVPRIAPSRVSRASDRRPRFLFVGATITVILVLQLVAVTVAGVSARRESDAATRDLFGYVGDATLERVLRFVEPAADLTDELASSIESGELTGNPETVAASLFERFRYLRNVTGAYIGYPDGSYAFVRRVENGYETEAISTTPVRIVTIREYDADFHLLSTSPASGDTYDPRARPWYQLALTSTGVAWTDPFVFFASGMPGVSATRAVRSPVDDSVIAVVGAEVTLDDLSTVLGELPLGKDGEAFILAENRTVVAAPPSYIATIAATAGGRAKVVPASSLGLPPSPPEAASSAGFEVFGTDSNDVTLERSFPTDTGIRWTLFLRATQRDLSTSVGGFERTMLWLTLLISALVASAAFVLYRVRRPIGELHARAGTDELTGLANRRRLREEGGALVRASHGEGHTVCVAVFDLDGFKSVNDLFGHDTGDAALKAVAAGLLEESRDRDLAARLGGDEFVVVMRAESSRAAERAIERTRASLETKLRNEFPSASGLGVTAGFTVSDGTLRDLENLIREADGGLVGGKRTRKGRTYPSIRIAARKAATRT